jgi:hypothetical protein
MMRWTREEEEMAGEEGEEERLCAFRERKRKRKEVDAQ